MYAPVGTVAFTALLLIEDPSTAFSGDVRMDPENHEVTFSPFSFNVRNRIFIYYYNYYDEDERTELGNILPLTVTLTQPLNLTDNITTYRYTLTSSLDGFNNNVDHNLAEVTIYERG